MTFARAQLRRLLKRDVMVEPGRAHHARRAVLHVADGPRHEIANAVHQAHVAELPLRKLDADGLVGDKARLRRHDRTAGAALRQLVGHAGTDVFIFDVGQHEQVQKTA